MVAAGYLRAAPRGTYRKSPPPGWRALVIVIVACFAVIAPLSGFFSFVKPQPAAPTKTVSAATAAAPATQSASITAGTQPGTVIVSFPPGTAEATVLAAVSTLGLSVVSGDVQSGRWVMALPSADVIPGPDRTVIVYFPSIASSADVANYFARNHLKLLRWRRDPDGMRFAIARLPDLTPKLLDAQRGYFSLLLPITDQQSLSSWAAASGVRIIKYDSNTGNAIVQPLNWHPAVRHLRTTTLIRSLQLKPITTKPAVQNHTTTTTTKTTNGTTTTTTSTATTTTQPPSSTPTTTTGSGTSSGTSSGSPAGTPAPGTTSPPPAPLTAIAADGHVVLSWTAVASATSYQIFRGPVGGPMALIATTTDDTFVDVGGGAGSSYSYRVVPMVQTTAGAPTSLAIVVWLQVSSQPTITSVGPSGSTLSGVVQLQLDGRSGDGNATVTWYADSGTGTVVLGTAKATSLNSRDPQAWTSTVTWNSTSITDGTYTVRAVVTDNSLSSTTTQSYRIVNSRPPAPSSFTATGVAGGVALSWQQPAFADAALYQIFRDGGSQPLVQLAPDQRSYVDTAAAVGSHLYTILLKSAQGQASDVLSASAHAQPAAAPTSATAAVVTLQLLLPSGAALANDGRVTGRLLLEASTPVGTAQGFEYSTDGTAWTAVPATVSCETSGCSADWNAAALSAGHYLVRAVAGNTPSDVHGFTVAAATSLPAPGGVTAVPQSRGVGLHWSAPTDATPVGYSVWRKADADWQLLDRVVGNDYVDNEAATSAALAYRVDATDANGVDGQPSAPVDTQAASVRRTGASSNAPQPSAPTGLQAVWSSGKVSLTWDAVTGATGYAIERAWSADGPFTIIGTTATATFVDRAGSVGGRAFYRVHAMAGAISGAATDVVAAVLIPSPAAVSSGAPFVLATSATPVPQAAPGDLELTAIPSPSPAAAPAAVLAGRSATVAATGAARTPVTSARIEVTSATGAGTWHAVGSVPAVSTSTGWSAVGPVVTSLLASGNYLVQAVALSPRGTAVETTAPATLQVTHAAPAPQNVQAAINGASVSLTWQAPVSQGPLTYSVYHLLPSTSDYVLAVSGLTTSTYEDRFLPGASNIAYEVSATDAAGNESVLSGPAWIATPISWTVQLPQVTLSSPTDAQAVAMVRGSTLVSAQAAASDGIAFVDFSFAPSGATTWSDLPAALPLPTSMGQDPSMSAASSVVWGTMWNTAQLNGSYDLKVIVTDAAGRAAEQIRTVTFTDDSPRGPPAMALTVTPIAGGVRLTWPASGGDTIQVRRSAVSGTGPFTVIGQTDGTSFIDSNLIAGVTYFYQLRSSTGAASATASASPLTTLVNDATGSSDGVVGVSLPDATAAGLAVVVVPASDAPALPAGVIPQGSAYEINATSLSTGLGVHRLDQRAGISFAIPPGMSQTSARTLTIYHFDVSTGSWRVVPSTLDWPNRRLIATVDHFSLFAAGDPCGTDPALCYTPSGSTTTVNFATANASLTVAPDTTPGNLLFTSAAGTLSVPIPTSSLTVLATAGSDTVEVTASLTMHGVSVEIDAATIKIDSGVTIDTTQASLGGAITLKASDSQTGSGATSTPTPHATVTVQGATLTGGAIDIEAAATAAADTSTAQHSAAAVLVGAASLSDVINGTALNPMNATVNLTDAQLTSTAGVTLRASGTVTLTTAASAASGDTSSTEAALATSVVDSTVSAQVSGNSSITAAGDLLLSATDSNTVMTSGDATLASSGAGVALAMVVTSTQAFINSNSSGGINARTVSVAANTSDSIATTAKASTDGASGNGDTPNNRTRTPKNSTGYANTADGSISVAGALGFTYVADDTEAYIAPLTSTTVAASPTGSGVVVHAASGNSSTVAADGSPVVSKASGATGVGVAIGVDIADVTVHSYVGSQATIAAPALTVEAPARPTGAPSGSTDAYAASATSGIGDPSQLGVAGSLAVNVVTINRSAMINPGASISAGTGAGNLNSVALTAGSSATNTAQAKAAVSGSAAVGLGATLALNIVNDGTAAGLGNGSSLSGAGTLTLNATTSELMDT